MLTISKHTVRYRLGWTILAAHFLAIFMYGIIGLFLLTDFSDVIDLVLSVTPLTALYLTAFLRYVVKDEARKDSGEVSIAAFRVQMTIVILFCIFLLPVGGVLFISGVVPYASMSTFVGLVEALFAGYMATIFYSLFPEVEPKTDQKANSA